MDEEYNTIYYVSNLCKNVFRDCVSTQDMGKQAWMRTAQGDFNLWCTGIKATSSNKSSLDYRLRDKPDVRDEICDLLRNLVDVLQICQRLIVNDATAQACRSKLNLTSIVFWSTAARSRDTDGHDIADRDSDEVQDIESWEAMSNESNSPDSSSGDESPDPFLSENISYIKTILTMLWRISQEIRKSGNKFRFAKADKSLDPDEDDVLEFRRHLTSIILRGFEDQEAGTLTTAEKIQRASDYSRLTHVQKRLVHHNILRRNRIKFSAKTRERKIRHDNTHTLLQEEPVSLINDIGPVAHVRPHQVASISRAPSASGNIAPITPARSTVFTTAVTATEVDSKLDIKRILARKSSSMATKMTRIGASQNYPRCPESAANGALICPYCDDFLPSGLPRSKREDNWRAHLVQDIMPYSCIIDDCDAPDEMYTTSEHLLVHMLENHSVTRWTCDYCSPAIGNGNSTSIDGESRLFDSAEKWELHISTKHNDTIPANQRATFAEMSKVAVIGPLTCPLCHFTADFEETDIGDHILQHLHEFALRALPEHTYIEARSSQGSNTSRVYGSLSHIQSDSAGSVIMQESPVVTVEEVEARMTAIWPLIPLTGISTEGFHLKIRLPYTNEDDDVIELWQTRLCSLNNILDAVSFVAETGIEWESPRMGNTLTDIIDELHYLSLQRARVPLIRQPTMDRILAHITTRYICIPAIPSKLNQRDDIMEELENLLFYSSSSPTQQSRVALMGPEGAGKTTIASMFVDSMQKQSGDCSVFWVDASTKDSLERSYGAVASEFGEPLEWTGPLDYKTSVFFHCLSWRLKGRWLAVLDGLQHETALHLAFGNLLPRGAAGQILFTASDPSCLSLFGPVKTIRVPKLDDKSESKKDPQQRTTPETWALLIGIDHYIPGDKGRFKYDDLAGRVNDVHSMREYLDSIDVRNLTTLTSTKGLNGPEEADSDLAKHSNVTRELERIISCSKAGDLVYIHYSGHGTAARSVAGLTSWLERKDNVYTRESGKMAIQMAVTEAFQRNDGGLAEVSLALADTMAGGAYLTGEHLRVYIKRMVCEKGLRVSLVLDIADRQSGLQDDVLQSDVQAKETVKLSHYQNLYNAQLKSMTEVRPRFSDPTGCSLLIAYHPHGSEGGVLPDGTKASLTYAILELLQNFPEKYRSTITYHKIGLYVKYKLAAKPRYTVILSGDCDVTFPGLEQAIESIPGAVVGHNDDLSIVTLNIGSAQGVVAGAIYDLFPGYSLLKMKTQVSVVEVLRDNPFRSRAVLQRPSSLSNVAAHAHVKVGNIAILRKWSLPSDNLIDVSSLALPQGYIDALEAETNKTPGLALDSGLSDTQACKFKLVFSNRHFEILEKGERMSRVPHTPLGIDNWAIRLSYLLSHLSRFRALQSIKNENPDDLLDPEWFSFNIKASGADTSDGFRVCDGTRLQVSFSVNTTCEYDSVYVAIFAFGANWEIEKIAPLQIDGDQYIVGKGQTWKIFGHTYISQKRYPEDSNENTDNLRAFISTSKINWDDIILPELPEYSLFPSDQSIAHQFGTFVEPMNPSVQGPGQRSDASPQSHTSLPDHRSPDLDSKKGHPGEKDFETISSQSRPSRQSLRVKWTSMDLKITTVPRI
ncbi:hypothetical protein TWF506_000011 [Arthrobotrys conoides]|uniref:Peptidase C14 caspase domain-containing protein n=1 Tax=Arthrobotrys conoides TaxID=74498 RepID=A0AAN8P7L7_9PEZI